MTLLRNERIGEYVDALSALIEADQGWGPAYTWQEVTFTRTDSARQLAPFRVQPDGTASVDGRTVEVKTSPRSLDPSAAWWDLHLVLRSIIRAAVDHAHDSLRASIYATLGVYHHTWVSEEAREAITDEMSLETTAPRIIERQRTAVKVATVNPYTDALTDIVQQARDAVCRVIGDPPRRGYKIRAAAAEAQIFDPLQLCEHLKVEGNNVKLETVIRSLSPQPAHAESLEFRYDI